MRRSARCTRARWCAVKEATPVCPTYCEENDVIAGLYVRLFRNISVESSLVNLRNVNVAFQKAWPPRQTRIVKVFNAFWKDTNTREILCEPLGVSRRKFKDAPRPRRRRIIDYADCTRTPRQVVGYPTASNLAGLDSVVKGGVRGFLAARACLKVRNRGNTCAH